MHVLGSSLQIADDKEHEADLAGGVFPCSGKRHAHVTALSLVSTDTMSVLQLVRDRRRQTTNSHGWTRLCLTDKSSQAISPPIKKDHHTESLALPIIRRVAKTTNRQRLVSHSLLHDSSSSPIVSNSLTATSSPLQATASIKTLSPNTSNSVHFRGRGRK
jgi:hypothetical protein